MNLHENKKVFGEVIEAAADEFNLQSFQVEKDYYVSLLLKNLQEVVPNLVFKGGTSLSKCYDVIHRFSEDIDLTINFEGDKLTSGPLRRHQKSLIQLITETIEKLDFTLLNDEQDEPIRSKRHFNKYRIGYNRTYQEEADFQMLDHILIETSLGFKPFPCEIKLVSNYITKFLEKENITYLIDEYNMHPFSMSIQSIDRTFLDKLFAVCDYHHDKDYIRKSRHIYDIHMIYQSGLIDSTNLASLTSQIIETRRMGKKTYSCEAGYRPREVMQEIIDDEVFIEDYETNTKEFLSKYVAYETSINSLQEIVTRGWLPEEIPEDVTSLVTNLI
ncbi:Nucleotidyl transferase AbiEii toxin, Type IV TA system [Gracilibacillus ureilyticus]|uniref:Nucleotidyl transferase AbiEii toxin, Type IV TA system n=1 Tax=Gracilibacillus ureilyticus TaxID=531814 RepID=A0A1H9U571_9BACI|nr:nucleotidyl transferase AbiEii/AbiGii toxin family protein [Gracilibacillus ureilyticus]SES04645.1 Nucleotidyl transferase AbiEii toxin, Type IV TA system [Gracilibacillus ureilyticus]